MNFNSIHLSRTTIMLIVLGMLVLAAVAYTLLGGTETAEVVSVDGVATSESEANFVTLAGELGSIEFDTRVLSDPRFLILANIHTSITPEPQGRPDPFGPLQ